MKLEGYLYRYISFESFVGMIQNKALTFVFPELWDDPKESTPFYDFVQSYIDNPYAQIIYDSIYNKTYGQCWTKLSESDAMWRIYSYNNRSIRLKVSVDNIKKLSNIEIVPVKYSDKFEIDDKDIRKAFLQSLAFKRTAFKHEEEVRLLKEYRFKNEEDMDQHIKAFLAINIPEKGYDIAESMYPKISIEEKVKELVKKLNIGIGRKNTIEISFGNIPDFIENIKIHPLAPDWYVSIVEEFCRRNNIPFAGKSTLYLDE